MLKTCNLTTSQLHHREPHLTLNNEVRVIKTLYDGHLMLQGQFRILLDNVGEGLQACSIIEKVFLLDFQKRDIIYVQSCFSLSLT